MKLTLTIIILLLILGVITLAFVSYVKRNSVINLDDCDELIEEENNEFVKTIEENEKDNSTDPVKETCTSDKPYVGFKLYTVPYFNNKTTAWGYCIVAKYEYKFGVYEMIRLHSSYYKFIESYTDKNINRFVNKILSFTSIEDITHSGIRIDAEVNPNIKLEFTNEEIIQLFDPIYVFAQK